LETWLGFQCIEQPYVNVVALKLRTADAVVDQKAAVVHASALAGRVLPRVFDRARNRLLLVGNTRLICNLLA
jgi:hypothetical protein